MKKLSLFLCLALLLAMPGMAALAQAPESGFAFEVVIPENFEGTLSGRFLVAVTESVEDGEPYEQIDVTGIPIFGKTVYDAKAGDVISFTAQDAEVYGYPMALADLPAKELYVQAFVIRYTKFERSNGTAIYGMEDFGGGGYFGANPLNLYSPAQQVMVDVNAPGVISLPLTEMIPLPELKEGEVAQQGNYEDTELVKYVKIQSDLLTEFWGTPIYIGANVLLPKDYSAEKSYPALYYQGHFPRGNAPLNYGRDNNQDNIDFTEWWNAGADSPDIVSIVIRDANMFYDTSYSVDSENLGPWGEAITTELIPYLEKEFNLIPETWARKLAGGSTGGWESMAMQVFYPDMFGGAWVLCADSLDFHYYQIVNLYDDENAYYKDAGWFKVERPGSRDVDGNIRYMMKDENLYEYALAGPEAISLGQWAIWEAVYGPMGENGYPQRVWDPLTGDINKDVVEYWKEHYDMNHILQRDWAELGPKLVGKLFLRGGDMDNYYLNLSQYLVGDFLETTTEPYYEGYSVTFPRKGHTGNITNIELLKEMADHMIKYGPENAKEILFGE